MRKFFQDTWFRARGCAPKGTALPPAHPGTTIIPRKTAPGLQRRAEIPNSPWALRRLSSRTGRMLKGLPGRDSPRFRAPLPGVQHRVPAVPSPIPRCPAPLAGAQLGSPQLPAPFPALTVRLLSLLCRRGAAGEPGLCGGKRSASSRPLSEPSMAARGGERRVPWHGSARLGSGGRDGGRGSAGGPGSLLRLSRLRRPERGAGARRAVGRWHRARGWQECPAMG